MMRSSLPARADAHAFAAVDLGASSGRVVLGRYADGALEMLEVHRFGNGPVDRDGVLSWDVETLFSETLVGLARAVELLAERGERLHGIGIDSWGVDYGLVDPERGFTGRVKNYLGADPEEPERAAAHVTPARAYEVTGVLTQHINTAYQLRSDARSGAVANGSTVLLTSDLWVYLLTGVQEAEYTIASTTQLLDPESRTWATELREAWGLSGFRFPELAATGATAGVTTPAITERIGAAEPVPVFHVAQHDTASALAFAVPGSGELLVSSGSWSLVGVTLEKPLRSPEAREAGFTNELGVGGSALLVRNLPGMLILTGCARVWSEQDGTPLGVVELVVAAAAEQAPASRFDVADPRLLSTDDPAAVIAELCREAGTPVPETRLAVVASIIESLAAAYADSVAACAEFSGGPIVSIRIVGGGSRNAELCRRTAELSGLPVTAGPAEASALGNLAVQLVAAGVVPDIAAAYAAAERSLAEVQHYAPTRLTV
ncbi:rhamnulokinase family protein [uncultured Schumannella sp.]|uniref:rhamnulokinase n=1 Tax=uncultured Schumannella sp. TaxID=1195956 RepID=UPI0025EC4525|nr:FGGY-family carbohydrate kinase [uncultured Schumannella sp.]